MTAAPDVLLWRRRLADAVSANDAGHPARAERAFRALILGLGRSADPGRDAIVLRARAHLGLATSSFDRHGRLSTALEEIDAAEVLAREAAAPELLAAVLGQRGLLHLRAGDTRGALAALTAAAAYLDAAEPFDRMTILLNRGALYLETGDPAAARSDLARCVEVAIASGHTVRELMARHNLGYAEFLSGNLPRALAEMAAAERLDPSGRGPIALLDQARVLREAGLPTEAESRLRAAQELYGSERLWQGVAETLLTRAECVLSRDPAEASSLARQARRVFRRRANVLWERKAEHVLLLAELADGRAGASARRLRALASRGAVLADTCAAEERRDLERSARLIATDALLLAGDTPTPLIPMALTRQDSLTIRLLTREVRARTARAAGEAHRARTEIRLGLAEVRAYQARFGSLDMRTASAVHGVALAELDLDMALTVGRPTAVLGSIERTRAASSRLPPVLPPRDEEEAGLLAELRVVAEDARALEGSAEPTEQARLRARAAELRGAVRARAWHREGSQNRAQTRAVVRSSAVRRALRDSEAFISLTAHRGTWHAIVVDGGPARHHVLVDVAETDELVRRVHSDLDALALPLLPPGIRASVAGSLAGGLAALDTALLAPLRLGGRPLVVSPTGMLAILPWGLLPSRRAYPTVVAPSATAWWTATTAAVAHPKDHPPQVSTFAGPGLTRARAEADAVVSAWGTSATSGAAARSGVHATTEALVRALTSSDVVHIAAHGRHESDNPLFSSLRMADGPLFAHELDGTGTAASCVVLSACEVGLWTVRPGDEALGLTSVLLQLGVRSVIAGVARVSDAVAEEVMVRMHGLMAIGADSATAIATAQAELEDGAVAPFVCFGSSWEVPTAPRTPTSATGVRGA
jgi:tetratricopeptide (TPR) repeat protein